MTGKQIFITIGVLASLALATYFIVSGPMNAKASCIKENPKIVAFGDSLVAGYGATAGNDFPAALAREVGIPVENLGRVGDTTGSALGRIATLDIIQPDIVIVLLGGNDALQRLPVATTKANLSLIIDTLQKKDIEVVLVGVPGGFGTDPFRPMFTELKDQYDVKLVPNILSGIFGNRDLMSDQIHPNDVGYARMAARVAPVIEGVCALD